MDEEIKLKIEGEYRDIICRKGEVITDNGWKSNAIVEDCGRFLAALMKKDFLGQAIGVEYIAVGTGSDGDPDYFRDKLSDYFKWLNQEIAAPPNGVWAKKIEDIKYLDEEDNEVTNTDITNKLKISVTFEENEPPGDTFDLKEFALVGIRKDPDTSKFDTERMFLINYVDHGVIQKDNKMELSRTIKLTFPIEKETEL